MTMPAPYCCTRSSKNASRVSSDAIRDCASANLISTLTRTLLRRICGAACAPIAGTMAARQQQFHAGDGLARTLADTPRRAIGGNRPDACPRGARRRGRVETNPGTLSRESASDLGPRCTRYAPRRASGSLPSPGTGRESPGTLSAGTDAASRPEAPRGAGPYGRFLPERLAGAFGLRPLWGTALALATLCAGLGAARASCAAGPVAAVCLAPKPVAILVLRVIDGVVYGAVECHAVEPAAHPFLAADGLRRPRFHVGAR